MYNVSASYKNALKSGFVRSRVELRITPKDGTAFTVTDAKILPNSLSVNNRATSSGDFNFGAVYVGAMNVTLINVSETIDRYSLFDAKIEVTFVQIISDSEEERIPLGTFYVSKPNRKQKTISLESYDNMTKFDKPLVESTFGTPYELLSYLCVFCGVPLGMTEQEVNSMPNGEQQFTFWSYANMTARDALSNIAKVLCGFATIDRFGNLVIRRFATTHCDEIAAGSRISSTIADYKTFFVAVTAEVTVDGKAVSLTALTGEENGLLLDLGKIQIAQGTQTTMQAMMQAIADELAEVEYTPATVEIIADPSYDLGDMVVLKGVNNTMENVSSVITSYDWKYHGKMKIVSDGRNALLDAVKSSELKSISAVQSSIQDSAFGVKTYTNSREFEIQDVDMLVATLTYSANKDTTSIVIATIPVEMSLDGNVVFKVYKDLDLISTFTHYAPRGKSIVTISNYVPSAVNEIVKIKVMMHCEYFESDKRIQDAQIAGLIDAVETGEYVMGEIDTTIPAATIDISGIRASVFAGGLNPTETWDGNIEVEDALGIVSVPYQQITVHDITDIPAVLTNSNNTAPTITELIDAIGISTINIGISQVAEEIVIGRMVLYYTINTSRAGGYTYNRAYVSIASDEFSLNETYPAASHVSSIDSGTTKVCDVENSTKDFASISGLSVTASGEQEEGGGSTSRLPNGYTEVKYIQSSGYERVETGYYATNETRIVVDMQEVATNSYPRIFANGLLTGVGNIVMEYENGVLFVKLGAASSYTNTGVYRDMARHWYEVDRNVAKLDGVQIATTTDGEFTSSSTIGIFAVNGGAGMDYAIAKLFSAKIYENDVLVHDYVPCKRNSDDAVGVYDIVGGSFLENAGNGAFTAGPELGLPSAYQEVEFIKGTGTQWIDTGFTPNQSTKIEMVAVAESVANEQAFFYGAAGVGYTDNAFEAYTYNGIDVNYDGQYRLFGTLAANKKLTIVHDKNSASVTVEDGGTFTTSFNTATFNAPRSMGLLATRRNSGALVSPPLAIYSAKIWNNDILVRDFVPCYRIADSVIGLYDLENGVFYTNAGTGTFVKGPDVLSITYKTLISDETNVYNIGTEDIDELSAEIEYTQSGSGDASPSNPRPISGYTQCVTTLSSINVLPINSIDNVGVLELTSGSILDAFNSLPAGNYKFNMSIKIKEIIDTSADAWQFGLYAYVGNTESITNASAYRSAPVVDNTAQIQNMEFEVLSAAAGQFTKLVIVGCADLNLNAVALADVTQIKISDASASRTYTTSLSFEGTNIFTRTNETDGNYLKSDGGYQTNQNYAVSDYIEVQPNKRYVAEGMTFGTATAVYHAWYDDTKTFISSMQWLQEGLYAPSNAKYVRLSYRKTGAPTSFHISVGTVMHGSLNVSTGVLTVDYAYISDLSFYTFSLQSSALNYIFRTYQLSGMKAPDTEAERLEGLACSHYKISSSPSINASFTQYACLRYAGRMYFRNDDYAGDTSSFKTSMADVQAIYELEDPCVYQLTQNDIQSFIGQNSAAVSTGAVTIEFTSGRTETDVAITFNNLANVVNKVGLLANLNAQMFRDYGFSDLQDCVVAQDSILGLEDFSIRRWCSDSHDISTMLTVVSAIPNAQNITTPVFSLTDANVSGIELVTTDSDGEPTVAIQFDNGGWEYYDTIDEQWQIVGQGSRGYMLVSDLENIAEQMWADKLTGVDEFQTRFTLSTRNDTVAEIQYKFLNE